MSVPFASMEPARTEINAWRGALLLEFGSPGCGHCRLAQPLIERVLAELEGVVHLKIADGPGQPLGRSFHVKLWPTLVFLRDGVELARLVRPRDTASIEAAARIALNGAASGDG